MRISLSWLNDYVELGESAGKVAEDLTMLGLVVESVEKTGSDTVLEVEVTSNRPDCLSHIGLARELAARYRRPLKLPVVEESLLAEGEEKPYRIQIKAADLCPRYTGLLLDGIRVAPSPPWIQSRLEAAGMRPVNNIVDITNYVLLEMGHPLHAFDFDKLRKGRIVVSRASAGQRMRTLDGQDRELDDSTLLINDGEGPVAIAGVMGGVDSEISAGTSTVLLECAYFSPASVRRTSKKLGLSTEASYRFERGVDWTDTVAATARTCHFIRQLAGGRVAGGLKDVYPRKKRRPRILLHRENAEKLLGVSLEPGFIVSALKSLSFEVDPRGKAKWMVTCPSWRADMELEVDLIEEIARLYGYQNIPARIPAAKSIGLPSPSLPLEAATRRILLGSGYSEAVNLSFAAESEQREFPVESAAVAIRNPLTEDTAFLRSSLCPGLVRSVMRNLNHGNRFVRLFEIGNVYSLDEKGRPAEKKALGIVGSGSQAGLTWHTGPKELDFYQMKGLLEVLMRGLRCPPFEADPVRGIDWLSPADACALTMEGEQIGLLGTLHPDLAESHKIKQSVCLAEIQLTRIAGRAFQPVKYAPPARFPAVERDLSLVLSRDIPYRVLREGIRGLRIGELAAIDLIDVYEGEKIPNGRVGMTLRLTFQDRKKTLTIDQVNVISDNVVTFLRTKFDAGLR